MMGKFSFLVACSTHSSGVLHNKKLLIGSKSWLCGTLTTHCYKLRLCILTRNNALNKINTRPYYKHVDNLTLLSY